MKKETRKFNRQLKKAEQKGREKALLEVLKLIPLSQQVIDYTHAGFDVTIHAEISSKELLKILEAK